MVIRVQINAFLYVIKGIYQLTLYKIWCTFFFILTLVSVIQTFQILERLQVSWGFGNWGPDVVGSLATTIKPDQSPPRLQLMHLGAGLSSWLT